MIGFFSIYPAAAKISETVPSRSITAYVGQVLTLECFFEGDPTPVFDLDRVGNPLGKCSKYVVQRSVLQDATFLETPNNSRNTQQFS